MTESNNSLTLKDLIDNFKDQIESNILVTLLRSDNLGSTTFEASYANSITLKNTDKPIIELIFQEYIPIRDDHIAKKRKRGLN